MWNFRNLILAGTALSAAPALADPIVVTATGVEQSANETGASISVLTRDDILDQQNEQLADILADLPGVGVIHSGPVGSQTSLRIRGAEADQTLVLINGVRVNDPSAPDGSFDFGNLLAGNIERVEILRGAHSVSWGSQAIGGVVNIETIRPTDKLSGFGTAEYGYSDSVRLAGNVSGSVGPLGISVGGGWYETDGISAFSGGTERDGYRQATANARLTLDVTDNVRLYASGYYADSELDNDNVFPGFSLDSLIAESSAEEIYAQAGLEIDLLDGRLRNRFSFSLADINRDIIGDFFTSAPRGRTERYAYRGDFRATDAIRLIFGAESEDSAYRDGALDRTTGIDSVFAQMVVKPLTGLTVTGGVRHDDHEDFGGETTFGADMAWQLGDADGPIIRAIYQEGFRAPSLIDLSPDPALSGNPELRPETAKQYELGISNSWLDGSWTASATLFQRDVKDQIAFVGCLGLANPPQVCVDRLAVFDPNDPFAFPPGTTFNIERSRVRGFELETILRPTEQLRFTANYTYLDSENRSAGANQGNELARRPEHSLYGELFWQSDFGLDLAADLTLVGDSFDDVANSRPIDGHVLVGLRGAYAITESVELYGRVENLFDEQYQTATDFGTYGRSAYVGLRGRF